MKAQLVIPIVALALLVPACTTLQRQVAAKIVARRATVEVLRRHPEHKPAFVASVTVIDGVLLDPILNRERLVLALQDLKIKELKGADGALIINDVLDLIAVAIADKPWLSDGLPELRAVAQALSEGMAEGIALSAVMEVAKP